MPDVHNDQLPSGSVPRRAASLKWIAALAAGILFLVAGLELLLFLAPSMQTEAPMGLPDWGFTRLPNSPAESEPVGSLEPSRSWQWRTVVAIAVPSVIVLICLFVLVRWYSSKSRPNETKNGLVEDYQLRVDRCPSKTASIQDDIDLFVSYSRDDFPFIESLIDHIRKNGLTLWIDTQHQDGDVRYAGQIVRAIRACRSVIIMCSENAYRSDHVVREVYVSGDHKKPFIVVQLDDAEFPDDFQYFLSGFPRIRLEEVGPDQLADKVSALMPA